ncbi:ABC transporter transmembrane domain-containing protein [Microvirga alba]|uniref:ABC transporter ATP-binding protein n=1 Tax=Microvirga alba TaxID=2791025 RepID=A0A931BRG2_9HYPH|nr:ABC transporter transmembrane domain-containing protein [Microvirga alba]MBF9232405.1 ABC transporter ATP-binding protein [Microvirga alba]
MLLSIVVFLVSTAPLELQRRIVNDAFTGGRFGPIALLSAAYLCLALTEGLLKLGLNIYRGWVSENAVRWLRATIFGIVSRGSPSRGAQAKGVEISIVLAEADPVGSFVGLSVSEPVLQGGILVSVMAYLVYLQPLMAVVTIAVLFPQIIVIPVIQNIINKRVRARIATLREVSGAMIESKGEERRQYQRIDDVFTLNFSVYKLKFSMNFIMNFLTQLGITTILALGGYFVVKGQTEIGTVVAFISGLAKVNDPWGDLVNWYRDLRVNQAKFDLVQRAVGTK